MNNLSIVDLPSEECDFNLKNFNIPETPDAHKILKTVKAFSKYVKNPLCKPEVSYTTFLGYIKLLWEQSNKLNDSNCTQIINAKCIHLLASVAHLYVDKENPIPLKFSDGLFPEQNNYKILVLRLISDYINVYCSRFSELNQKPIELTITVKDFDKIVSMAYASKLDDDINILEIYKQVDYLQINSLKKNYSSIFRKED